MSDFSFDQRVKLTIELALTAERSDIDRSRQQDAKAKRFGMTGAEIDAARQGYSFDALASIALELAIATRDTDARIHREARTRALRAGIPNNVCHTIERFAESFAPKKIPSAR